MKNYLLNLLFFQRILSNFFFLNIHKKGILSSKIKFSFLLFLFSFSLWAQPPHTFIASGTLTVPAGITSMDVQAWGGGGSGGGAGGAGVLVGRGAAGGGGGAYAKALITVVAGTNLNVVVAGITAGTFGDGSAGGNSTINGFENIIMAVGGGGGGANTNGIVPTGGLGGKAANSFGTTKADGVNGGAGQSALLTAGLSSGAGGKGGLPGGGNGGAAITSTLFGNSGGSAGTSPGGGGSGAINSAGGVNQIGGDGSHGQVVVTYTCPTYSILGVAATNVCSSGGTSTITLTANPGSLPVGIYTVTYNLSNPVATGITKQMTVTTAGIGSFSTDAFTAVATRVITISTLTSGVCVSNISSNNTANITISGPTVGGSVSGGTTVCNGTTSAALLLTGHTGSVLNWQYSISPFTAWTDIPNTTANYTSGALTQNTQFRAVVQNGACAFAYSAPTTVTVIPKPSAPQLGQIVQPTCVNPTGSVVLNGLIATANWTITQNGTFSRTYSGSGTTFTIPNLAPGSYTFTIHENSGCLSSASVNVNIIPPVINIWNGVSWSKGSPPIASDAIEFSGNYSTTGDLNGCSCAVNSGANVTVNSNNTLTIANSITNNGGTLTFENNASLLQTNNAINTGNIIYKRNTMPVRRYDLTYWSSPVTRTPPFTLKDLSPDTLLDKYFKYDPVNEWVSILNGAGQMDAGIGYVIRAPQYFDADSPAVFSGTFIGVPNNGPVSVPISVPEKFYLLGNPYPSAIYADQFIVDNQASLYGTLLFWTHNSGPSGAAGDGYYRYNSDDYAYYNLTGDISIGDLEGTGATTPGNQNPPLGYIAAGQSFFVKSKAAGNAVFTNFMRVPGNNSQFFKNSNTNETTDRHRLWLNLTNTQGAFKQILIGYVEGATNSWDNLFDAITLDANKYLDFYSINELKKLVIQGRALPFLDTDVIPLGYRSTIAGEFTISIDHADGDLSTHAIYLEDKMTNTIHDLKTSDYTFKTTIGTFDNRFVLRYNNIGLGTDDFTAVGNDILVFIKDKTINVRSAGENINEVTIFDLTGKLVFSKKKIDDVELQIPNLKAENQVLIIKTTLRNDQIISKKIMF